MPKLVRFGVSLEEDLFDELNRFCKERSLSNRSQTIRSLIREHLVEKEWLQGKEIVGTITLVYNNTKRTLMEKLTSIQHSFHNIIISTQHIHLDHDNCLEIIVLKGKPLEAQKLCDALKSVKGVKHSALTMTTTGSEIP